MFCFIPVFFLLLKTLEWGEYPRFGGQVSYLMERKLYNILTYRELWWIVFNFHSFIHSFSLSIYISIFLLFPEGLRLIIIAPTRSYPYFSSFPFRACQNVVLTATRSTGPSLAPLAAPIIATSRAPHTAARAPTPTPTTPTDHTPPLRCSVSPPIGRCAHGNVTWRRLRARCKVNLLEFCCLSSKGLLLCFE